jgi:hypothetical protein
MVEYYIKKIKDEYIVKERNNKLIHSRFSTEKQAIDKVKRLNEKDKISVKSKRKEEKNIPKNISNPDSETYEIKTLLNEGLKDNTDIKKLKIKKKFNDLGKKL